MRPFALVLTALLAAALQSGCGEGCDLGATWCEGDFVMVCVDDADPNGDDWDEDDSGDDSALFDLIELFIELAEDDTRADVLEDCWGQGKTCVERYDENDEPFAECGFGG